MKLSEGSNIEVLIPMKNLPSNSEWNYTTLSNDIVCINFQVTMTMQ